MAERIGVYICECGPNIKDALEMDDLVGFAQGLENVVVAKPFGLLCSKEGKAFVTKEIQEHDLTRVVFAACSHKEHEATFQEILKQAGLNPFLMQIANIREQCAWVIPDKALATEKAKALIHAAVNRVVLHEPLEVKEIDCQADVLVVGAGVAGMSAALTLAQKNRKVYLVEKSPCIGGKAARLSDLFPNLECASCVLDPKMDEVLHNSQIEVLTYSEVQEVLGFYGNFTAKVNRKATCVDPVTCIGCAACFEVCPVKVPNEYNERLDERKAIYIPYAGALPNLPVIDKDRCLRWQGQTCTACQEACPFGSINYEETDTVQELHVGAIVLATGYDLFDPRRATRSGYGKIENVYTSLEFERLINSSGPTGGKILLKNGNTPQSIALVHCVGSRTGEFNEHCSGVCCAYLLKFAHQALEKLPGVSVRALYSDLCLPGKEARGFFDKAFRDTCPTCLHMREPDAIDISEADGVISIRYTDVSGQSHAITADMVVLAPAMEGARDAPHLAKVFHIPLDEAGFFVEEDAAVAPVSTVRDGIFVAGCAQGPKDIQGSVAQGQAAAGAILSRLIPGEKLSLEPVTAKVDETLCSGCKTCISLCPYKAITYDSEEKHATVNEILCRGCGVCPAACPSGAIQANHFTDMEVSAEIRGLVGGS